MDDLDLNIRPAIAAQDWSNTDLHGIKRALSVHEKSTLQVPYGQAVVLPGSPGGEIEELVRAGFSPREIHAIEHDKTLADILYEHYFDRVNVHWEDVGRWMAAAHGPFRYVHLDYCGHVNVDTLGTLQTLGHKLGPYARVRVSTLQTRRGPAQKEFEASLYSNIVTQLITAVSQHSTYNTAAQLLLADLADLEDPVDATALVLASMLLNQFFGVGPYEYADRCNDIGPHIPPVQGFHRVNSMQRYSYNEVTNANSLHTIWVDLVPMPSPLVRSDEDWVLGEIMQVLRVLRFPVPSFE